MGEIALDMMGKSPAGGAEYKRALILTLAAPFFWSFGGIGIRLVDTDPWVIAFWRAPFMCLTILPVCHRFKTSAVGPFRPYHSIGGGTRPVVGLDISRGATVSRWFYRRDHRRDFPCNKHNYRVAPYDSTAFIMKIGP